MISNACKRLDVNWRRSKNKTIKKKFTYKYHLTDKNSTVIEVCKAFFLTTLGFNKKNDREIFNILNKTFVGELTPPKDKRTSKKSNDSVKTHNLVSDHIELFHPTISHYRREHAPNVRYLPSDINIKLMHEDFNEKYPDIQISYEFYRLKLKEKNISFAVLGHEECEICEAFKLPEHINENMQPNCEICITNIEHTRRYKNARDLYKQHAKRSSQPTNDSNNIVYYSADLQKLIMLPRVDTFKKVIFV